jgi:hypothetical protein
MTALLLIVLAAVVVVTGTVASVLAWMIRHNEDHVSDIDSWPAALAGPFRAAADEARVRRRLRPGAHRAGRVG